MVLYWLNHILSIKLNVLQLDDSRVFLLIKHSIHAKNGRGIILSEIPAAIINRINYSLTESK